MRKNILLTAVLCTGISVLIGSGLLFSCTQKGSSDPNDGRDYEDDDNDDDRDTEQTSRKGGGNCEGKDSCEELCEQLFGGSKKTKCIELTVNEVKGMHSAFNDDDDGEEGILVNPDYEDDLKNSDIFPDDVYNAMKIDDNIWSDLIDDYSTSEAKDVMLWLANNPNIFKSVERALRDDDDELNFLADLFKEAGSNSSEPISSALTIKLGKDSEPEDTFMALTSDSNLRDRTHQLLIDECLSESNNTTSGLNIALYYPYSAPRNCKGDACEIPNIDYQKSACALGEVYCKKDSRDKYIFEDTFGSILDAVSNDLSDYITEPPQDRRPKSALDFDSDNNKEEDEIEDVCEALCLKLHTRFQINRPDTCKCTGSGNSLRCF